jgi:uncharacterized protein (TIGR02466 family)
MKFQQQNLFYSPVWEFDVDNSDQLNRMLIIDGQSFSQASQTEQLNYIDFPGYGITQLREHIVSAVSTVAAQQAWPAYTPEIRSRQNVLQPLECDTPHHHPNADLIAVYYVSCPDRSGDILIHDPRGSVKALWQDPAVANDVNGSSSRVFYRLRPRPGLLVMFPNYMFHSVETNLSSDIRISIVMNIRLNTDLVNEYR